MASKAAVCQCEALKEMPTKRVFATAIFLEDQLFILGGCDAAGQPVDAFEQYDGKKKWKRLLSMPTKRAGVAAAAVGKKIVAIAGVSEAQTPLDAVEVYDATAKTWTAVGPLGEPVLGVSAVTRSKLFSLGY
jgi:N-acetylneuraminic acid mutarotase